MNAVAALEEAFNIEIDGGEIDPDNFISLEALRDLVKRSGGAL